MTTGWQDKLNAYLKEHNLRFTTQRQLIAEVFFESERHLSFDELYDAVRQRDQSVGQATIYRTLRLLTDSGLASTSRFGGAAARYEPAHDDEHHDHLICIDCGRIIEFFNQEIEELQEATAKEHNFRLLDHKMELYGTCMPKCEEWVDKR